MTILEMVMAFLLSTNLIDQLGNYLGEKGKPLIKAAIGLLYNMG